MLLDVGRIGRQASGRSHAITDPGVYTSETLDLNFADSGVLDSRITFTRAAGPATYFDSAGVLQTAGTNIPRFDYDPVTLAPRGLLIEEARTNGLRNSTMVGAAAGTPGTLPTNWTLNAGTTGLSSQVVGTGIDSGFTYIDFRIFGTAAATTSYQLALEGTTAIAALTGQAWVYSLYWSIAAGSGTGIVSIQGDVREMTAAGAFVRDNLAALSITGAALATQRVSMAATLSGGGTVGMVQPRLIINVANAASIDFTLRIAAPQLELGAFPTSYITTTAAAATRAVDVATMSLSPWFSQAAGTFISEAGYFNSVPTTSFPAIVQLHDGTTNNFLIWLYDPAGARFQLSSTIATVAGTTIAVSQVPILGTPFKVDAWYDGTTRKLVSNVSGTQGQSTTAGGIATVTTLQIGNRLDNLRAFNGHLRRLRYWSRALSVTELQSATV